FQASQSAGARRFDLEHAGCAAPSAAAGSRAARGGQQMAGEIPRVLGSVIQEPRRAARGAQIQKEKTEKESQMNKTETLQITTPSDREIAMTHTFDAPRTMVFEAWTKPELLKRWLGVRGVWSLAVCYVDLNV